MAVVSISAALDESDTLATRDETSTPAIETAALVMTSLAMS